MAFLHSHAFALFFLLLASVQLLSGKEVVSVDERYDAIVVGSGVGGLGAAARLGRAGKRVLLVEKHWSPGGCLQTFSRTSPTGQTYPFAVGLHYLVGGVYQSTLELISGYKYPLYSLNTTFNHLFFKNGFETTQSQQSADDWVSALLKEFPLCQSEILSYYDDLKSKKCPVENSVTTLEYLDKTFDSCKDPRAGVLKTLTADLLMDLGDTGTTASWCHERSYLALYQDGGMWYPNNGPDELVNSMIGFVESGGGKVLTSSEVLRILTDGNAVTGVEIQSVEGIERKRVGTPYTVSSSNVISDMGIKDTFAEGMIDSALLHKYGYDVIAKKSPLTVSLSVVWLAFNQSDDFLEFPNQNIFVFTEDDYVTALTQLPKTPRLSKKTDEFILYEFTFESRREPGVYGGKNISYAVVFMPTPYEWFVEWENSTVGKRPAAYDAWKEEFIVGKARKVFYEKYPQALPYEDVVVGASPLTLRDFLSSPGGAQCGVVRKDKMDTMTSIDGLYLAGKDTIECGVEPSALSGWVASEFVLV